MIYKARRAERLRDTLELCNNNGNIVKSLDIDLDVDIKGRDLITKYNNFLHLSRQLRDAQATHNETDFYKVVSLYTLAVDELFSLAFGENNKVEIYEFYDNNYIEMVEMLIPYIFKRVIPAAGDSVSRRKNDLKTAFKRRL